ARGTGPLRGRLGDLDLDGAARAGERHFLDHGAGRGGVEGTRVHAGAVTDGGDVGGQVRRRGGGGAGETQPEGARAGGGGDRPRGPAAGQGDRVPGGDLLGR